MNIRDIQAKKGDRILPKWKKLLEFISNTGVITGPGVRISRGPNGTQVFADHFDKPYNHPFKVSRSASDGVSVRAGTINNVYPYIDEVPISGRVDGENVEVPPLTIEAPQGSAQTYVVVTVVVEEGNGPIQITDDPEKLYMDHIPAYEFDLATDGTYGSEGIGIAKYPIATIYWDEAGDVETIFPIVHHNLGHRFLQGNPRSGYPARHLFWAV